MKKLILIAKLSVALTFITTFSYSQPITINTAATPAQMVANLVGPGITYSNVTYTGDPIASAIFTNGNTTNLGMTSGVVLTSGSAALIPINNSGSEGFDNAGPAIPALNVIAGANTFDGCILEFDFIPYSTSINVRYIFGSDEYLEWVNAGYNDAFAFFISGPGIVGQENLATVGGQPVTIDNINTTSNSAFYINNPFDGSLAPNKIEYDGFTRQLLATRTVIPCSTYHIKLMIADGGDPVYDSGVFIEENGLFSSGNITDVTVAPAYGFGSGYEGCVGSQFIFNMPNAATTNTTFTYTVGGTATPGLDYIPLPTSITIPAGQTTASIPVTILDDNLVEGPETITLTVQISPCSTQTFTLTINDPIPINLTAADASFCQGAGPVNISAATTGGNGTMTYAWNNGAGNGTPVSVNPAATTTYTVTATDQCGKTATANSTVTVTPLPVTTFTATTPICQTSASTLTYTGNAAAAATYNWNFAGGTAAPGGTTQGPHTVSWAGPGSYPVSLTVTQNGCTGTPTTQNVTVIATPATPTVASNSPVCTGGSINLTSNNIAGATYVWTGPNGFTAAVQNPTIPSATTAMGGTYNLYLAANGCTSLTATANVTVNPTPAAPVVSSNTPVCSGNAINLTANNVAGATYAWTGPGGFTSAAQNPVIASATTAMGGTYSLYVTGTGCTSATADTPVVVNPTPATPVVSSNTPVCSGNTINLTTNNVAGATYTWTGPGGFTSAVQNPAIASATTAMGGTYSLYVTVTGCPSATAVTPVVVNPTPAAPVISSNSPVCAGNTLNLDANTIAGATYAWTGPNGFASAAEDPSIANVTVAASGSYSASVTVTGCSSPAANLNVTVTPLPVSPAVGSNSPICQGGSINLTAGNVAGAAYHWSGPNAYTSAVQNPAVTPATVAMSGTYSVYVTASGCTSATVTTPVTVNPTPATPVISSNSPVCAGSTLNLTSNTVGGAAYAWSGPNAFASAVQNPAITPATTAASGTYSVYATVAGCTSATATLDAVVNPIPAAPVIGSNTPVCQGNAINLTADAVTGATYAWSGPNAYTSAVQSPVITPAAPAQSGTYSAYVVVLGCTSATAATPVLVNPTPATPVVSSNTPVCSGNAINLTSTAVAGATYVWTGPGGFTSAVQSPVIASATTAMGGTYSLYVTVTGCTSATAATPVVVNPTPAAPVIGSNGPVCAGETLNLTSNSAQGLLNFWSGPNGFTSPAANPSIASATTGMSGTYSLYTSIAGCTSSTATVSVLVRPVYTADFALTPQICLGADAFALYNGNGPANAEYHWEAGNGATLTGSGQGPVTIRWGNPGVQTMTLTVALNGCASVPVSHDVTIIAPVIPDAGPDQTLCSGAATTVGTQNASGATFSWTTPDGIDDPASAYSTASWTNNGHTPVTVTLILHSDNQGCTADDEAVITVVPNPTASFAVPAPQCFDDNSFGFQAGGSYMPNATFQWAFANAAPSNSVQQNPAGIGFNTPGANDVTLVVAQMGCISAPFTAAVTVMPGPQAGFSFLPAQGCAPVQVGFTDLTTSPMGGATYSWNFGNGGGVSNQASPTYTYNQPGIYSVTLTVQDASGCTSSVTQSNIIQVYGNPTAGFTANPQLIYIDEPYTNVYDASTGGVTDWHYSVEGGGQFTSPGFVTNFSDTGLFAITQTVTNAHGCTDVFMQTVHVLPVAQLFVPNTFTPGDRDELNAVFKPVGFNVNGYHMYIYNRWGEMLFSTQDINIGWDGRVRYSDVEAKPDQYVYKIEYTDHRGNPKQLLGNVLVLR